MNLKKYFKRLWILVAGVFIFNLSSMVVSANANTLNIKVFMSSNECQVYGVPGAFNRLTQNSNKVKRLYNCAGVSLNFIFKRNNEHIISTYLEDCTDGSVLKMKYICFHCSNDECTNNGTLHHSNVFNIINQFPNSTSNYAVMLLTPNNLCYRTSKGHSEYYGATFPQRNKLFVSDYDFAIDSSYTSQIPSSTNIYGPKTMAHEIGHLYGVTDHYNITYGTSKDECIWGALKNDSAISNELRVCSDCFNTLVENNSKYNHTPIN